MWREVKVYDVGLEDWEVIEQRRYVWDGWKLLEELDAMNSNAVARQYTWGLDLAGLMGGAGVSPANLEAAGTIGGLLAVHQEPEDHVPANPEPDITAAADYLFFYDGNGNVGQLVAWADTVTTPASYDWDAARLAAAYQYTPYGAALNSSSGPYKAANRFRFSTKPWDPESGLGYWGYRYYDPRLGRWIGRDPIGERGGANLYAYVLNSPLKYSDGYGAHEGDIGYPPGSEADYLHRLYAATHKPEKPTPPPPPRKPFPIGVEFDGAWAADGPSPHVVLAYHECTIKIRAVEVDPVADEMATRPTMPMIPQMSGPMLGGGPVYLHTPARYFDIFLDLTCPLYISGNVCCQASLRTPFGTLRKCWGGSVSGRIVITQPVHYRLEMMHVLIDVAVPLAGKVLTLGSVENAVDAVEDVQGHVAGLEQVMPRYLCALLAATRSRSLHVDSELRLPEIYRNSLTNAIKGVLLGGGDGFLQ